METSTKMDTPFKKSEGIMDYTRDSGSEPSLVINNDLSISFFYLDALDIYLPYH